MQGSPSVLKKAVAAFADYCSHRRYRAVIGNVAPADGHRGRMEETTRRWKEVSRKT